MQKDPHEYGYAHWNCQLPLHRPKRVDDTKEAVQTAIDTQESRVGF